MKFSSFIATCSTVILSAICLTSYFEIQSTDKITAVIEEKPSVSQTYNNYETNNYYEDNNEEELQNIQEQLNEIKETQEEEQNEEVLVGVDQYGVVYKAPETQEVWRGPKSYKCNRTAGYPAECGYCGEVGEIHFNIKEWQDTNGTYHLTHVGCGQKYCEKMHVEPRVEESYKIR